jgi:hypothetical protein
MSGLDDPVWPFVLRDRLRPYIIPVREWWATVDELDPAVGIFPIEHEEAPGLFYRFTNTKLRSPVRGVQVFPFVIASYLQITGVASGSTKLVSRLLAGQDFFMDEFVCLEIKRLPSMFNQAQLIAIVPTEQYFDTSRNGSWVYLTKDELSLLIRGKVSAKIREKAILRG